MLCCKIPTLSGCCKACQCDTDNVLSGAKVVLETVSTGTSNIPIPGIDLVIQALIGLIDKIQETTSNSKGFTAVSREVSELVNVVKGAISHVQQCLENIPSSESRSRPLEDLRGSPELRTRIAGFCRDLEALKAKADKLYNGPWCLRWFHSSRDAATLEELREGVVACIRKFQLECQVAIEASVNEVLKKLSEFEDENTLELLPRADASYRTAAIAMKIEFLPKTRIDLFQKIDDWVNRPSKELSNKAVCILTGDAGTGKSTIAHEFAKRCHVSDKDSDYGASFFFVLGEKDLDSTRLVFPTLAYQLARSQDAFYPHIVKAAREYLKNGRVQLMDFQAPSLIHGPIHAVSDRRRPMVLIIDALDECSESEEMRKLVPHMLDLLIHSVQQAQFPLRIFFTSRPDSLIEKTLQQPQWASLVHRISIDGLSQESVEHDMTIFVRDKLERQPSVQALLQDRPEVAGRLAKRAKGQFVYAQIVIDFLSDHPRFVDGGLDNLLSRGSSTFATKLQPLDDLYLTVLETTFPAPSGDKPASESLPLRPMLGNLAVLRNPMSLVVLEALTGVQRDDICKVLTPLRAVVAFNEAQPDEKVRVRHSTFSQFLVDPKRCMNESYYDHVRHHHSRLVVKCLDAMQAIKENMCQLPDPTVPKAEILDLAERLGKYIPEHVQYACVHWAAHLKEACRMRTRTNNPRTDCYCWKIGNSLEEFVGTASAMPTKLRAWVEIMAYMGRLDTVAEALHVAQEHLKDISDYEEVKLRFAETKKLVADHYSEIEECPYKVHQF